MNFMVDTEGRHTWRTIPTSVRATARTMFAAEWKWSSLIDNYARENTSAVWCWEKKRNKYEAFRYIDNPVKRLFDCWG